MKDFLFRAFCYDKNGKFNYDRASKFMGYTKSDLYFMCNNHFEYLDTPTLMSGVFVGFHPTSKSPIFFAPWHLITCHHSKEDLTYLRHLINGRPGSPSWATYEYFVMDASGNILYKNCNISQTIDENGVFHLKTENGDLNHYVYPVDRKKYGYKKHFCYGSTHKSLNSHIRSLAEKKFIKVPKHFKKGFSKTPEHPFGESQSFEKQ